MAIAQQTYDFSPAIYGDTWDGVIMQLLVNDVPKDITGASIRMSLVKSPDTAAVATWSTANGRISISDAANGEITFIPFTMNIAVGTYYYDIEYTFADNSIKSYVKGKFTVVNDITK
jgi:hypothetical protein